MSPKIKKVNQVEILKVKVNTPKAPTKPKRDSRETEKVEASEFKEDEPSASLPEELVETRGSLVPLTWLEIVNRMHRLEDKVERMEEDMKVNMSFAQTTSARLNRLHRVVHSGFRSLDCEDFVGFEAEVHEYTAKTANKALDDPAVDAPA
jgi:hypothetical protein